MKTKIILTALTLSVVLNGAFFYIYNKSIYKTIRISDAYADEGDNIALLENFVYHDGQDLTIVGRCHNEPNYGRLPARFKGIVRKEVWELSNNSSGVSIKFRTNSSAIGVRWKVKKNSTPTSMTRVGANGVDLYCLKNGRWQYVNSGIPTGLDNESLIITDMDTTYKDFMLNLPLYNTTESVRIGIQPGAVITKNTVHTSEKQPIVFYGTSITQGRSASRPGMNYPSIISRNLNTEVINLGFSGNGRFEASVGMAVCNIDSKLIVLDCTPNSHPDTIKNNVLKLIRQLRRCQPETPILIVESIQREYAHHKMADSTVFGSYNYIMWQNKELKKAYQQANNDGIKKIYYLEAFDLIGVDHEGTVDGTHPNDLGLLRIANKIQTRVADILEKSAGSYVQIASE